MGAAGWVMRVAALWPIVMQIKLLRRQTGCSHVRVDSPGSIFGPLAGDALWGAELGGGRRLWGSPTISLGLALWFSHNSGVTEAFYVKNGKAERIHTHIYACIYKQRFLSMRHYFHVKLPGSSFPSPQAHWYESFPAFFLCNLFQLMGFVRLWLCYMSQFEDALQLKLVLVKSFCLLSDRSGRRWGDTCLKSITFNQTASQKKSGSFIPVYRAEIPIQNMGVVRLVLSWGAFVALFWSSTAAASGIWDGGHNPGAAVPPAGPTKDWGAAQPSRNSCIGKSQHWG